MKKVLAVLFFGLLFSVSTCSIVLAQPVNSTAINAQEKLKELRLEREELKQQNQERQEKQITVRDNLKEQVATKQADVRQRVVGRIKAIFSKIVKRFNAALIRLDKIADRVASRIDKLRSRGVDTSKAETALASAESLGAKAASAISDAQAKIDAIDAGSATVHDAVHVAREAVVSAKSALFDYHKGLVAAIRELKSAKSLKEGTNSAE